MTSRSPTSEGAPPPVPGPVPGSRPSTSLGAALSLSKGRLPAPGFAAALLLAAFLLAYLPDAGHGFVKDDFAWIARARVDGAADIRRVLFDAPDFYRPAVMLSFSVNHWLFGLDPLGYGLTNLMLAIGCAVSVAALARAAGLPIGAALLAAALWAFNFHGINMAVLWISGRTALWLTLFATLAARAAVRGRAGAVFGWSLLAAASKEEAVLLPLLCGVMAAGAGDPAARWLARDRLRRGWSAAWPSAAAAAIYLALRLQSGAMTPASAPAYYQLSATPALVARNILEYADRSSTLSAAALLAALAVVRRRPAIDPAARVLAAQGAVWVAIAFAVTVWLPVRSSLYAVWPGVGAALASAAVTGALWTSAGPRRQRALVAGALILPFLLWPAYRARNVRWVELADLTRDTLRAVSAVSAGLPGGSIVVLRDDRSTRANFNNAFGTLYPDAAALAFGSQVDLRIDPLPDGLEGVERPAKPAAAEFRLIGGRVERIPTPGSGEVVR